MTTRKLITVFAATGNQGSSVINTILSSRVMSEKYSLRGTTRDTGSANSKALASKGVEMVTVDLNDPETIASAVKGSYGAFINTDYWTLLDKAAEVRQGKAILNCCIDAKVHHVVLSSLPYVSKLSNGKYQHLDHFDSKAEVAEYASKYHGDMIISYFEPAMYFENIKQVLSPDQKMVALPFADPDVPWPMISPSRDTGNYVTGLFEAVDKADGVTVQAVSEWTTPNRLVKELGEHLGTPVAFNSTSPEVYESYLPEKIRLELGEMMQWIGEASYYGIGTESKQAESDKWLLEPNELTSWKQFIELEY